MRRHQRESVKSAFVFVSERGAPLSAPGFSRMVERAWRAAKLGIKVHAHMLRHACGHALANAGHDTRSLQAHLGYRNIQNTTWYAALAPDRFKGGFGKTSQWGRSNKLDATRIHKATRSSGIAHQVGRAKHQALQLWKNLRHSSERKDRSTRRLPLRLLSHRRWQQQICTTTWQPSKGTFKPNTT